MRYPEARDGKEPGFEIYSDLAVQHFMDPQHQAPLEQVSGKGCTSSSSLEEFMQIAVHIGPHARIDGVRCRTVGCMASVACGSVFTELVLGCTTAEALALGAQDVVRALGGLPESRLSCAELPLVALRAALEDIEARRHLAATKRRQESFVYLRPGEVAV